MGRLDGKVAIVTGSARGTGEIIARLFVSEGAKVVLGDVLDDRAKSWVGELGDGGTYAHLDITEDQDWRNAVDVATSRYGPVTVLVHNAAVLFRAPLLETPNEEFDRLYKVNLRGAFQGIKAVADQMKAVGGGSIVNISSVAGLDGPAKCVAYSATKWGLRDLARVAAVELGILGIRVNNVMAGGGNPEMNRPFHPGLTPEDRQRIARVRGGLPRLTRRGNPQNSIAAMVLFLASDESYHCHGKISPWTAAATLVIPPSLPRNWQPLA